LIREINRDGFLRELIREPRKAGLSIVVRGRLDEVIADDDHSPWRFKDDDETETVAAVDTFPREMPIDSTEAHRATPDCLDPWVVLPRISRFEQFSTVPPRILVRNLDCTVSASGIHFNG
jgi:hypothetical protein